MQLARIEQLLIGKAVAFTRPGSRSAIAKQPVEGAVAVGVEGLEGDEQGDRRVHGGPYKALHHYPFEHYRNWRDQLGDSPLLQQSGPFGENIRTRGLVEADLCLGDLLRELRHGSPAGQRTRANAPVLMLSAQGDEIDRVLGLDRKSVV